VKYGACTWIFGDEGLGSVAARLSRLDFDGLELLGDLGRYTASQVLDTLGEHDLAVLSLTPANVDLAHPDERIRADAVDYYLHLLDFAAEVGKPVVSCHGLVPRFKAIGDIREEYGHLCSSVKQIAVRAKELDLRLAMEVLNRYEAHLLNTASQALEFVSQVGSLSVGILLDTYHMNIEEADPVKAILDVGSRLYLYHVADSNRQAVGRGHVDFLGQTRALRRIGYTGSVIVECSAIGPDPFTPDKGPAWRDQVWRFAEESLHLLKAFMETAGQHEADAPVGR